MTRTHESVHTITSFINEATNNELFYWGEYGLLRLPVKEAGVNYHHRTKLR